MQETRLKRLTLFLLETLIVQGANEISNGFAYLFNEFIYKCYKENEKLLDIIYDKEILEEFIEGNYEILSLNQMYQLINRYHGFNGYDGYINLLDDIGSEVDAKLNKLVLLFVEYQKELVKLYYADSSMYYPKGYPRILQ